jgi:hypothetical protein
MRTAITASALAVLALACGPSIADEREPLGTLEHEYGPWTGGGHGWASGEWYRLDRRIELVPEQNPYLRPMCGTLTDAAYDELEATIAALDPSVDYPPPADRCGWSEGPSARVHLEGFTHGPFSCDWLCCHDELAWIPSLYFLATNELSEDPIEVHDQPFPVIDIDWPCD